MKPALLVLLVANGIAQTSPPTVPIDFSFAGYESGGRVPQVPAVLMVRPSGADDTALIQGAIDRVSAMPVGAGGFRGAVLLARGRFHVSGQIHLRAGGTVLRGSGREADGTVIVAEGQGRRTLIEVGQDKDPALESAVAIVGDVPVGGRTLPLNSVTGLKPGMGVVVRRPSTAEWIAAIGMTNLPGNFANIRLDWKPGSHDLVWDRTIVAVNEGRKTIEIDAPITTALESRYGAGTLAVLAGGPVPAHIGIEDLVLESAFDRALPMDEEHSWIAVLLDRVQDAWVRRVTARHFVSSAVRVNLRGRRITVEDCRSESPVAEKGGYRRQGFYIAGQQVLVHRCASEAGMNDFSSGMLAGGPNVFLDCDATGSLGASGAFEGWSSGVLYENVRVPSAALQLIKDSSRAQGAGWTAANSVIWNSQAKSVEAVDPPGAHNLAAAGQPPLFAGQLLARTGRALEKSAPVPPPAKNVPEFRLADVKAQVEEPAAIHAVKIVNGRFVVDGRTMWGPSQTEAWWKGDTSIYTAAASTGSSVTRFMPGETAPGETEDLAQMAARLKQRNVVSLQVNPGLWYEHRRDAHTVDQREDGNVWAPFYEMPWARSGQGTAWDGLSKFDLTRYNPWYFSRHREFAQRAAENGFLVFYDLYNTHNVLEIGPHWIDYAWRPPNNINDTGLPEPPPYEKGNALNVGNQFYSISYAPLKELHRAYILHSLDEMAGLSNVFIGLAYQYAGPLAFQQFFLDVIREWEEKHQQRVQVVLTTSKETTDAILADPVRARQIAVVDMRYWEYRPDGSLFAPPAGINLAFRKQIQQTFPGYSDTPPSTTPELMYRATREYRDRYPRIALMPMENGAGPIPILMAGAASRSALVPAAPPGGGRSVRNGGQDSTFDAFVQNYLSPVLMKMSPQDDWTEAPERTWTLAGDETEPVLIYSLSGEQIALVKPLPARNYSAMWFDPRTGSTQPGMETMADGKKLYRKPDSQDWLLLLQPQATR